MKVVPASEMARVEQEAFNKGASQTLFMEEAGRGVAAVVEQIVAHGNLEWQVSLLCGKGNNGGDAYVAGYYLLEKGYQIRAFALAPTDESSNLCQENHRRFCNAGGEVVLVDEEEDLHFFDGGVIIDGILGTGFKGEVTGIFASAIRRANVTGLPIIAIDIPSGVNGNTGETGLAIEADATVYLGLPKTGFFLGDGWNHLGALYQVDFGLPQEAIDDAKPDFIMLQRRVATALLPPIVRNRHKYQAGYVVGVAGSPTMPGAALLASFGALRAGAGMVRLLHPPEITPHALGLAPEVLAQPFTSHEDCLEAFKKAAAVFLGPGLGQSEESRQLVAKLLPKIECPVIIDADALNLLAKEERQQFPSQTIITPHAGEMRRLLGDETLKGVPLLQACQKYVDQHDVILVLKGGPTHVFTPKPLSVPWVITRGDPGMATAGCGDVLTGIIAALLAQGSRPSEAALLGVYLHGVAGESAADDLSSYSMVASDISHYLPAAFAELTPTH